MKALVAALALVAASASAQTVVMPMDSPWAVWDSTIKHTVSVTLLRRNATTGNLEAIAGQRVAVGPLAFRSMEIRASFPGQKTSSMFVAGVRLIHEASGEGWVMPEHNANVAFPAAVEVPPGRKFGCTYAMPVVGKGKLTCEIDSTVVTGVILPPPPAPTRMPPGTTLTDASGAVWTTGPATGTGVAPGQVALLRNGAQVKGSVNYGELVGGVMHNCDPAPPAGSGSGYERWNGTAWTLIGAACP